MEYDSILEKAMELAQTISDNPYHCGAFANSVAHLVTGWSGGYGGPSIREHICSHFLAGDGNNFYSQEFGVTIQIPDGRLPHPGNWSFDHAAEFCKPICFNELSRYALKVVAMEYCFDDDPQDILKVSQWEIQELKELSLKRKKGKLPQKEFMRWQYLKEKYK